MVLDFANCRERHKASLHFPFRQWVRSGGGPSCQHGSKSRGRTNQLTVSGETVAVGHGNHGAQVTTPAAPVRIVLRNAGATLPSAAAAPATPFVSDEDALDAAVEGELDLR